MAVPFREHEYRLLAGEVAAVAAWRYDAHSVTDCSVRYSL
jgi:hypothetical protein